jgi:large subunit ribosomal protein L24
MHIKTNDIVEVITGDDRGAKGKVLKVLKGESKVVVEGINRVYKHVRRSQRNLQGGRLSKEMPVSISNVLLVCSSCGKATRTGARVKQDGSKERFCKKCGTSIGALAPAKEKKAAAKKMAAGK